MTSDEIFLLKQLVAIEKVSVSHYDGGQIYALPVATFLFNIVDAKEPVDENGVTMLFIDCSYHIQMGIPFMRCEITCAISNTPLETVSIPLDVKQRTKHQKELASLISACSKRIITQEMSRKKLAIDSALQSFTNTRIYS